MILLFQLQDKPMQLNDGKHMNEQIQNLIKNKVELDCFMCLEQFDCADYAPMIMCMNEHSCCAPCLQELLKTEGNKPLACPHCQQPVNKKLITKNRHLMTIFELITAYKKYAGTLQDELERTRRMSSISNNDMKGSLLSKSPKMVRSFILNQQKSNKALNEVSLFDDPNITKSQTWVGNTEKRRQVLLAYAEREKIQQLKNMAKSDIPLEQVTSIRSGYGTIKKIQCMEYFPNLRELLLYNNHIHTIQGLNNNSRLNILSLAYNKIQKIDNLGHLKELKRLSLECNKIGKSSAEYLSLYEWRNLESLTISFHEENKQDNDLSLMILFDGKSHIRWGSLKTLYIYNSKTLGEHTRQLVKQFASNKKNQMQVYWS